MPDVKCQIAWNGGYRVPMASWTWTDVSAYVELADGINVTWGRGDERSTADANTLSLTLDNSDGRFTAARTTSPYYPNVLLYKPIRVLADPVDGAEMPLFTGYINAWPVAWEDTDAYAKVSVSASSRLARLGLNAQWRSLVEETYLYDSPVAYYPLGDPEGSTLAADVSGLGAAPLPLVGDPAVPVVFGTATGPGTDDLTAATFAGGQYLGNAFNDSAVSFSSQTAGLFFLRNGTPASNETLAFWGAGSELHLFLNTSGKVQFTQVGVRTGLIFQSSTNVCDGAIHHAALTIDGTAGRVRLYVDGVLQVEDTNLWGPQTVGNFKVGEELTGVLAHVARFPTELTAARVLAHATAGLTGHVGETTDARFDRYALLADIPTTEVNSEAGSTTVVHIDTTGGNVVDLLRQVEATEAGVMFDALDGTLTLHNRAHRYTSPSVLTLDFAKHEVGADYSPRLDPTALANDITVIGPTTSAHVVDTTSIDAYGIATTSSATASQDINEPVNLASWAKHKYAQPKPRVPALTVDALAQVGKTVTCAQVMAVTVGDKITVANHPQQAALSITDYFVEGGSFTIGPEKFEITWNVSPSSPEDQVFVLDSATRGVLDTSVLAL